MKITRIKLTNIGPYKNEKNELNLNVTPDKNIILIGGKNGAGKTTLLNSIKIGLFGTYAFGLKNGGNIYFSSLKKIFNYVEAKKKLSNYEIQIDFELVENYINNKYTIFRSWKKVDDDITEILRIKKNNIYLRDSEKEEIQTKLKEIMPPAVVDTMLFDGEKIAQIIDDNKISEYLKEIINVNFNINIFEKMDDDINFYIEKEKNRKAFSTDEINLLEYKNKYNECVKNVKNLQDIFQKYKKTLDEQKFKLKGYIKKFENYGGLTDSEKFAMRSTLEKLEQSRKKDMASIKEFLEDDIVFYLNQDRIKNIKREIEIEKPILLLKYVSELSDYMGEKYVKNIREKLENDIGTRDEIVYHSSQKLINQINRYLQLFEEMPAFKIKRIFNSTKLDLNDTRMYKKIIGNNENDNSKDLQRLLYQIKNIEIDNEELSSKIKIIEKDIKKAESEMSLALIELETIEKKVDSEKKEENSFNIARKLLEVSKQYQENQIGKYLSQIAELSVKKFEEINKKENYITKILIEPITYSIRLFDNNELEKDITILSAGEKQLLISAIIWSIFKLSNRVNMFTFDTPLARLDKINRELFVEKVLCTISNQVMILSTDEEIVGNVYSIVQKSIGKEYMLVNDEKTGTTRIEEEYF